MPLYNFSLDTDPKHKGALKNSGVSGIRKFAFTPNSVAGTFGQNQTSYIRVLPNGDLVAEGTYKNPRPSKDSPDSKTLSISDPNSIATVYTLCRNNIAKKNSTKVADAK
jgi:hypothetical protein